MPSIQSSTHPPVFPVGSPVTVPGPVTAADTLALRTSARVLEGMQKEAIVSGGPQASAWRMVCDEGPYLNGTDLAPFPLAFFTAGLAACYLAAIRAALAQRGLAPRSIELTQDNRYTMTGSALQGTMTGGALPVELRLRIDADADAPALSAAVTAAIADSPATALLRAALASEFALTLNDERVATGRVPQFEGIADAPPDGFDTAAPAASADFAPDIIARLESAQSVPGVEGGAGTSLAAEQNRTLHVHGTGRVRPDGLAEIRTQLLKPIGSVFRFLADDSGTGRAPSGLAYLSAGIAFCYLTQLGRYAHIVKRPLTDYRIVQDTRFPRPGSGGAADPVRTHVFLKTAEGLDYARTLVDMGEQTCFLHAACRASVEQKLELVTAPV